jgi:hypothetical protein
MPGYARCPNKRCRKPLPRRATTQIEGGTSIEEEPRRWPLIAVLAAAALGVGLFIYLGGKSDDKPKAAPVAAPTQQVQEQPTNVEQQPSFTDTQPTPTQQPTGPDPTALASALERDLKRQRLWSTVTVSGGRVDVRSGSCDDPAMNPTLESAMAGFKAAGLTKLRCVEQSGRVVTDRDL